MSIHNYKKATAVQISKELQSIVRRNHAEKQDLSTHSWGYKRCSQDQLTAYSPWRVFSLNL